VGDGISLGGDLSRGKGSKGDERERNGSGEESHFDFIRVGLTG